MRFSWAVELNHRQGPPCGSMRMDPRAVSKQRTTGGRTTLRAERRFYTTFNHAGSGKDDDCRETTE
jgi:hypothetical protein